MAEAVATILQDSRDKKNNALIKSYKSIYRSNVVFRRLREQESECFKNNMNHEIEDAEKHESESDDLKSTNININELCRRPTTIRIKIEEEHKSLELIRELVKNTPKDSFGRIAILTDGIYHIGFKDNQSMHELLMNGFMFKEKVIQPALYDDRYILINIKDLPYDMEPEKVIQVLSQYGKIICHKMTHYQEEISWLETGELKIGMLMFNPIPNTLLINNEHITISCRNLAQVCGACKEDYFADSCNENGKIENISEKQGHDRDVVEGDNSKEQLENVEDNKKKNTEDSSIKQVENIVSRKGEGNYNNFKENFEDIASTMDSKENADVETSEVEEAKLDSRVGSPDEYEYYIAECTVDNEESKIESVGRKKCVETVSEFSWCQLNEIKSDEEDEEDSGYSLENSNSHSDDECKDQKGSSLNKNKNQKADTTAGKEGIQENNLLKPVKERTFLDTVSTQVKRSDFDCERVLVTIMDKIKDSLSLELGENINRRLLAEAMDNHNYWAKWCRIVYDRRKVNWYGCCDKISAEYRMLSKNSL